MLFVSSQDAIREPGEFLSIVTDGMAQGHCQLPWQGNMANSTKTLPQHLQGVVAHGRHTILYRTFHTVAGGANLQIHTFLLTLERVHQVEGMQF